MPDQTAANVLTNDVWIDYTGGRIFARMWDGPDTAAGDRGAVPIVLFHDSLGCVELWRDFPAQLAAASGRRVIAYDRPGFGRSDPRTDKPALNFIAEEAESVFPVVRERLGIRRFIAFGHSVGGGMAVNCASRFVSDCSLLITESAQVFPEERTLDGIRAAKAQFQDGKQIERLQRYHGAKARWVLDAWTETWLDPAFASWSLADILPGVTSPVLAIHGSHDEYGSLRHPQMIGNLCAGPSQIEVIDQAGHVPHRENPALILSLVCEFIRRHA